MIYQHFVTNLIRHEIPSKHPEYEFNILGDQKILGYENVTSDKLEGRGIYKIDNSIGLQPDGQVEVIDKHTGRTKTWIAIDTKFYE
mgnify:CR=1 FL=1